MNKANPPTLRCYMSWMALEGLPHFIKGKLGAICDAGYQGVQLPEPLDPLLIKEARRRGLGVCGSARVNQPTDADKISREARSEGLECVTLHLGWGLEDDQDAQRLIGSVLEAGAKHDIPLYPETHRATIFQDMWRTVQFVKRFPELRFNGDFSHWYTGSEMVYGGFETKVEFIGPVLKRIRFLHGRIGNPGSMQVAIDEPDAFSSVEHFKILWKAAFAGYINDPLRTEFICFTPELLSPAIFYGRVFQGREEADRWKQSKLLTEIARECWIAAMASSESDVLLDLGDLPFDKTAAVEPTVARLSPTNRTDPVH